MDNRVPVELSRNVIELIESVISSNQILKAAVVGIYEGARLKGNYELKITGVQLVPMTTTDEKAN